MFKKYQSIENHYNQKYIDKWFSQYPELFTESYIVSEKLDGANVQFYFKPGKKVMIGRRNSWLEDGEKFFGIWDFLRKINLSEIQNLVDEEYLIDSVRIYCEFIGEGINNRIKYFGTKQLVLHDVEINDRRIQHFSLYNRKVDRFYNQTQEAFDFEMIEDLIMEKIEESGIIFNEAYTIEDSFLSAINKEIQMYNVEGGLLTKRKSEGVVIRPYYLSQKNDDEIFIIKKKNTEFDERPIRKEKKVKEITNDQKEFLKYINENRLKSVFSKEGEISEVKEISKYIKLIMTDAMEDFKKDYPLIEDSKVFSLGGNKAARIIKDFLQGEKNGN